MSRNSRSSRSAATATFDVAEALSDLHSVDADVFEKALNDLRLNVRAVKEDVFLALQQETDPHVRGALIELLGDSRDPAYIPCLAAELDDCHAAEVRFWALAALQRIGTTDALAIVKRSDLQPRRG